MYDYTSQFPITYVPISDYFHCMREYFDNFIIIVKIIYTRFKFIFQEGLVIYEAFFLKKKERTNNVIDR